MSNGGSKECENKDLMAIWWLWRISLATFGSCLKWKISESMSWCPALMKKSWAESKSLTLWWYRCVRHRKRSLISSSKPTTFTTQENVKTQPFCKKHNCHKCSRVSLLSSSKSIKTAYLQNSFSTLHLARSTQWQALMYFFVYSGFRT